jgi:hypothetical protein
VLSCGSTSTTAASDAHPASHPLPGVTGYRTPRSGSTKSAGCRAGEGLPSSRRHPRYVPRPIRRGVPHGCASRLFAASMAFAPISRGSALPAPALTSETPNDAAGFASCYGPHRRSPKNGLLTLGSDPARFPAEPPACYRASWQLPGPDSHRQATTSLRTRRTTILYVTWSPPVLLGARPGRDSQYCRITCPWPGNSIVPAIRARYGHDTATTHLSGILIGS